MALLRLFSITKNSFSILSRDSTDPYSLFSSSEVSAFLLHPLPIFVFVSAPFFTSFCSFSNLLPSLSDPSRFSTSSQVPSGQLLHHMTRCAATSPTILLSRINSTSFMSVCHSSSSFRYMLSLLVNKQCHQVRKGFIAFLLDDIA